MQQTTRACRQCGGALPTQKGRGRPRVECDECRRTRQTRRSQQPRRSHQRCPRCSAVFLPSRSRQIYCTVQCRQAHARERRLGPKQCAGCGVALKRGRWVRYCEACRPRLVQERRIRHGLCGTCEQPLTGGQQRYCSRLCKEKAHSRRRSENRERRVKPDPTRGNRRDEWRYRRIMLLDPCAYCGQPAAEIDHIEPRAKKGSNGWENSAGICRSCNMAKLDDSLLAHMLRGRINREITMLEEEKAALPGARN